MSETQSENNFERLTTEPIELADFLLNFQRTHGAHWHSLSEALDWLNEPFNPKNPFDGIGA